MINLSDFVIKLIPYILLAAAIGGVLGLLLPLIISVPLSGGVGIYLGKIGADNALK